MSRAPQPQASAADLKSDEVGFTARLIACGHGDTLLLRLPGPKWILIDCHLPTEADQDRFFSLLDKLGVSRLEMLFLSHPHYDHYAGMADIIERLLREKRGPAYFGDTGSNWVHVLKLLEAQGRPNSELKEYAKLVKLLTPLVLKGQIRRYRLDEDHKPIRVQGQGRRVQIVPLAPRANVLVGSADAVLLGEKVRETINNLCVVLVLQLNATGRVVEMLLAADAETEPLEWAIEAWKSHDENGTSRAEFDAIKVPHHGSVNGHVPSLCRLRRGGGTNAAAISVGTRYNLPSKRVISDYQDAGWTVVSTTRKVAKTTPHKFVDQFNRSATAQTDSISTDVTIMWAEATGLVISPPDSAIPTTDVHLYDVKN